MSLKGKICGLRFEEVRDGKFDRLNDSFSGPLLSSSERIQKLFLREFLFSRLQMLQKGRL